MPAGVKLGPDLVDFASPRPHKRADCSLGIGPAQSSPSMAQVRRRLKPAFGLRRRRAGECPEWQRELTVNQPPHGFAGSSPASPTNKQHSEIQSDFELLIVERV